MSRLRFASLDMTVSRDAKNGVKVLVAKPPKPSLLPPRQNAVIPSEVHNVHEVEESHCYKGACYTNREIITHNS